MYVLISQRDALYTKFPALSFYPGRGDTTHALSCLNQGKSTVYAPEVDDDGSETEDDDPIEDEHTVELALRHPNRFSESLVVEVSL